MSIHKIGSDLVRPSNPRATERGSTAAKDSDEEELARVERADSVQISAEGRELAAQLLREGEALSASRAELIRSRVSNGFYDGPAVAHRVAERLQASGDLDVLA